MVIRPSPMRHPPLLTLSKSCLFTIANPHQLGKLRFTTSTFSHVLTPHTTNWLTVALLGLIWMSLTRLGIKLSSWVLTTMNSLVWMLLLLPLFLPPIMARLLASSMNMLISGRALQFIPLSDGVV